MFSLRLEGRYRQIFNVLFWTLILNWAVALSKIIYGWMSQSGSMFADGIHSLSDGASNIIGLIGISMAAKPPDDDHPYGHKKYETFAALAISTFLLVLCVILVKEAIGRFHHPVLPQVTWISFAVMIGTMGVNAWVTWYERKKGKELTSDILLSDSLHTQTDLWTSFTVIIALIGASLGFSVLDPIATLLIAGFIGWAGIQIVKSSSDVLCDHVVLDVSEIQKIALSVGKIRSCHEIRTRGLPDHIFVDLSVHVRATMSLTEAHDVAHQVEDSLKQQFEGVAEVIVHIEPDGQCHANGKMGTHATV